MTQLLNSPSYKYPKDANYKNEFPVLDEFLENRLKDLLKDPEIRTGMQIVGGFQESHIDSLFSDVEFEITELCEHCDDSEIDSGMERNGYTTIKQNDQGTGKKIVVQVDEDLVTNLENAPESEREARLLAVISTLLHETIHYGDHKYMNAIPDAEKNKTIGNWRREYDPQWGTFNFFHNDVLVGDSSEVGAAFETGIWHNDRPELFRMRLKQGALGLSDQTAIIQSMKDLNRESAIPNAS